MDINEFLKEIQKQKLELDKNSNSSTNGIFSFVQIEDEFSKVMANQDEAFVNNMKQLLQQERSKQIEYHISHKDSGKEV